MSYTSDVRRNIASLEHSKFVEIQDDVRFPAISATRIQYTESSELPPVTSVEVYPRHAVVAYVANASDISGGGGAGDATQAQSWDVISAVFSAAYVAFPSTLATTVTVVNNTGTSINVKKTTGTVGLPLPDRTSADFTVVANANEISFCRTDGLNTPVTAYGIATLF